MNSISDVVRFMKRELHEFKGSLIFVDTWGLNVFHSQKTDSTKAVVKIDSLRFMGNEGEATIGDPRDFHDYGLVKRTLKDPERQSYHILFSMLTKLEYTLVYDMKNLNIAVNKM